MDQLVLQKCSKQAFWPTKRNLSRLQNFILSERIRPRMGKKNNVPQEINSQYSLCGERSPFLCLELSEKADKCKACQSIKMPKSIISDTQSYTHHFEFLGFPLPSRVQLILVQKINNDVKVNIPEVKMFLYREYFLLHNMSDIL